jgi:hypothetical protein
MNGQGQRKGEESQSHGQAVPLTRCQVASKYQITQQPQRRQERDSDAQQRLFELRPRGRSHQRPQTVTGDPLPNHESGNDLTK